MYRFRVTSKKANLVIQLKRLKHDGALNLHPKYADKVKEIAKQKGISVGDLRESAIVTEKARQKQDLARSLLKQRKTAQLESPAETKNTAASGSNAPSKKERKDNSPVVPLSSLMNLPKILASPHTPKQITELWEIYHASKSGGTGRGYVCAGLTTDTYSKMTGIAKKYPSFLVPVPKIAQAEGEDANGITPHEFYFLQWNFHQSPSKPSASDGELFATKSQSTDPSSNPAISTVIFTPLAEYKHRQTFATPHFVLTFYTDLVETHGLVLMRGEITPSSSNESYMLSQLDAQVLAFALQKFYLWSDSQESGSNAELLRQFHLKPEEFKWEDLLKTTI